LVAALDKDMNDDDELLTVLAPLKQVFEVLQGARKPTLQFVVA
jgi:hypothetical protein